MHCKSIFCNLSVTNHPEVYKALDNRSIVMMNAKTHIRPGVPKGETSLEDVIGKREYTIPQSSREQRAR
jgi:hypothetical protein